ncbi:hypothetical protein C3943_17370 [Lysinibacillus sp. B2A1]|nr:hypothetical protein C3943_17370 [Lysinibacillus sp. B2A1]
MLLSIIVPILILISCNEKDEDLLGPSVTSDEAEEIAKNNFKISTINSVELRHLSEKEFDNIPFAEAKDRTPVYFVIQGIDINKKEVIVFVNSNEKRFNYIKY